MIINSLPERHREIGRALWSFVDLQQPAVQLLVDKERREGRVEESAQR